MVKKNDDYQYFNDDKDVSIDEPVSVKPYLLRGAVIFPILILVVLTVGSFMFMNMLSSTI
jgi:hypothetical protein